MSVSDDDWAGLEALLASWWPGEFDEGRSEAYRLALRHFAADQIAIVLERRLMTGATFRPSAAELVADLTGTTAAGQTSPEAAWQLIVTAIGMVGVSIYDDRFAARHQAAVDWLAGQDVVVAGWAAQRGLCGPRSLGAEPVADPGLGGMTMGALRNEFTRLRSDAQARLAAGLPAVDAARLIVASPSQRRGSGGLHRPELAPGR